MISQTELPNTTLTGDIISKNVILCCGENESTLFESLNQITEEEPVANHFFRSYSFYKYTNFTLVTSGIGTGCIEPLLFELLSFNDVKRIILIGTAGCLSPHLVEREARPIHAAYVCCTGLDMAVGDRKLSPRWADAIGVKRYSTVSTDLYYGFSNNNHDNYTTSIKSSTPCISRFIHGTLQSNTNFQHVDLVDMEVGQFYFLCSSLRPNNDLEFLAIKGPANSMSNHSEQNFYTLIILDSALKQAMNFLHSTPTLLQPTAAKNESKTSSKKMLAEIKLYWTIQVGVASILGYLSSKLSTPGYMALISCLPVYLVLLIGAIYNIIGNYYIRIEGAKSGLGHFQENIVTPFICKAYLLIAAALGSFLGLSFVSALCDALGISSPTAKVFGLSVGIFPGIYIAYYAQCKTFWNLYKASPKFYKHYAKPLTNIFPLNINHFFDFNTARRLLDKKPCP
ncbi:MAG: hypothetical protein ACLGQW_10975 [Acidobacteriota bacterium]